MGGVAFIPGVGWVISGVYFIGNAALEGATGHNAGYYIEQGYNAFDKTIALCSITPKHFILALFNSNF